MLVYAVGTRQVYQQVNNGVYRSGFATTQRAYDQAQYALYATLDELETRLGDNRFLMGDRWVGSACHPLHEQLPDHHWPVQRSRDLGLSWTQITLHAVYGYMVMMCFHLRKA